MLYNAVKRSRREVVKFPVFPHDHYYIQGQIQEFFTGWVQKAEDIPC